tara:strand:- start:333 stop:791 length:459 start_codon:yes stop_codon:yes gene_type:complete
MKIVLLSLFTLITFNLESNAQEVQTNENGEPPFNRDNPYVHDPVMAKDGDTYYVFGTGVGISVMSSKDLKTWKKESPIFEEVPEWTKEALPGFSNHIWAPDIIFYQGRYHIFYSCNAKPGKPHAAIGHASTPTSIQKVPILNGQTTGKSYNL